MPWDGTNHHLGRFVLIQVYLVDRGVELVIMCTEGIQNVPNHIETVTLFAQNIIRIGSWWKDYRNDDVTIFLALEATHHTTNTLNYIHLTISSRGKNHGIQRRYIHSLRKAAHIGEDTTFIIIPSLFLQPF